MFKSDQIILTGSDSNVSIRSTIVRGELNQLDIDSTGSIVIESKYLLEIIRKMDCTMVELELVDYSLVRISSDNGQFNLMVFNLMNILILIFLNQQILLS